MPDGALWPLGLYFAAVLALVALVLAASHVLGERHAESATGDAFESGIVPVHRARFRIRAKFYVVAMLFVIFDIEAVYIITWALIAREGGWAPYVEIAIFIVVLIAALAYLWRVGALDWGPQGKRRPPPPGHWTGMSVPARGSAAPAPAGARRTAMSPAQED